MLGHETVGRSTKEYKIKNKTTNQIKKSHKQRERERERENQRKKRVEDSHVVGDAGVYLSGIYSNVDLLEVFDCVVSDFSKMKKRSSYHQIQKCKVQRLFNKNRARIRILFLIFK